MALPIYKKRKWGTLEEDNRDTDGEFDFHRKTLFPFLYDTLLLILPKPLINILCEYCLCLWLSPIQEDAMFRALEKKENLFITGGAGVGKSFLIKLMAKEMQKRGLNVFMCASFGLAATHLPNGLTLHHFMGVGLGKGNADLLLKKAQSPAAVARWRSAKVLFIDEISTCQPYLFELLHYIAQIIRENKEPFGGIQLIVSGDMLQLPAVHKDNEVKYKNWTYVFETAVWKNFLTSKNTIYLRDVFRQKDAKVYNSLNRLRLGAPTKEDNEFWLSQVRKIPPEMEPCLTFLCNKNKEAEEINQRNFEKICPIEKYERKDYFAEGTISRYLKKDGQNRKLAEGFLKMMHEHCLARPTVTLAVGAKVMLLVNLDPKEKLINGSCGEVIGFHGEGLLVLPKVRFRVTHESGTETITRIVKMYSWRYEVKNQVIADYSQIPFMLAWAITIHKCIGMSLKDMAVNVSKSFTYSQAYTALSRMQDVKDVYITGYHPNAFRIHPLTRSFEKYLQDAACLNSTDI